MKESNHLQELLNCAWCRVSYVYRFMCFAGFCTGSTGMLSTSLASLRSLSTALAAAEQRGVLLMIFVS